MSDARLDPIMEREDKMVVHALAEVGISVLSVYDLQNSRQRYPEAIPVLLSMLSKVQNDRVKEGIACALAVKEARPIAAEPLIREFLTMSDDTDSRKIVKWTIAYALSVVADDTVFDDIVGLLRDTRHGQAREMIAYSLGNMRDSRAVDVLIQALTDEVVAGHAVCALGKLKAKKARSHVERFLHHPKSWIRQEAKKALAKIDKAK